MQGWHGDRMIEGAMAMEREVVHPSASPLVERIAAPENLFRAWRKVQQVRGGSGIDGVSPARFEDEVDLQIAHLSRQLLDGSYVPFPVERGEIPKPDGSVREIGILAVRDRVVQRAALNILNPICDRKFLDVSYAYRPNRSTRMVASRIQMLIREGFVFAADMDITDFFGSLRHDLAILLSWVFLEDEGAVRLIAQWLAAGCNFFVSERNGQKRSLLSSFSPFLLKLCAPFLSEEAFTVKRILTGKEREEDLDLARLASVFDRFVREGLVPMEGEATKRRGTVQGAPISPMLANIYLHPFDLKVSRDLRGELVRFADDFLVLCQSEKDARWAYARCSRWLSGLGLAVNEKKSRISHAEEGFEFVGYRFTKAGFEEIERQEVAHP